MKRRWPILTRPSSWSYDVQASVIPALCALHNFMRWKDPDEVSRYVAAMKEEERKARENPHRHEDERGEAEERCDQEGQQSYTDFFGTSVDQREYVRPTNATAIPRRETQRANHRRNEVAAAMWAQYKFEMSQRQRAGLAPWTVGELFEQADAD